MVLVPCVDYAPGISGIFFFVSLQLRLLVPVEGVADYNARFNTAASQKNKNVAFYDITNWFTLFARVALAKNLEQATFVFFHLVDLPAFSNNVSAPTFGK